MRPRSKSHTLRLSITRGLASSRDALEVELARAGIPVDEDRRRPLAVLGPVGDVHPEEVTEGRLSLGVAFIEDHREGAVVGEQVEQTVDVFIVGPPEELPDQLFVPGNVG